MAHAKKNFGGTLLSPSNGEVKNRWHPRLQSEDQHRWKWPLPSEATQPNPSKVMGRPTGQPSMKQGTCQQIRAAVSQMSTKSSQLTRIPMVKCCNGFFFDQKSSPTRGWAFVFSPYYIRLSSLPPVENRTTSGKAPLQRGCHLIYTRNIHRDEILICLLEVG